MKIDFEWIEQLDIPNLNGGEGRIVAKMFADAENKIMLSILPTGASIGMHRHISSSEINYCLNGSGKAICDGQEERMELGCCHYCPKGSEHSIANTGEGDLVLFTVVPEHEKSR